MNSRRVLLYSSQACSAGRRVGVDSSGSVQSQEAEGLGDPAAALEGGGEDACKVIMAECLDRRSCTFRRFSSNGVAKVARVSELEEGNRAVTILVDGEDDDTDA